MLVFVLGLGAMFILLYAANIFSEPKPVHSEIPTKSKISQLEALTIIEKDVRTKLPEIRQARLTYLDYNFTSQGYSDADYMDYRKSMSYSWNFDHVKQYPELLQIPLIFFHANGTVYDINAADNSVKKKCDEPSITCLGGRQFAKDRLVYMAEIVVAPQPVQFPFIDYYYLVDAETGKIVWNSIDYQRNIKPMSNVNFDNRTISQLYNELARPPQTTYIDIEQGASDQSANKGYLPKEVRVVVGQNNRVVWTNRDAVMESVVSDAGYFDQLTGKKFDSGPIPPNGTFEFTFTKAGQYSYHAEPHPWMRGTVEVVESFG